MYKCMNACPVKGDRALKILNDPDYKTQEKFKGIRAHLYVYPTESYICTRGGFYVEANFPHLAKIHCDRHYVLDGELWQLGVEDEIIAGWANSKYLTDDTSGVSFQCFDILEFRGNDLTENGAYATQSERDMFRRNAILDINHEAVIAVPYLEGDPEEIFAEIVQRGGEGIIRRNMSVTYCQRPGDNRPANYWYKLKSTDTYDVVFMGCKPGKGKFEGLIGSVAYGMYVDGKLTCLGYCSGMNDDLRYQITHDWFNFDQSVWEVKAAGQDSKSHALIEPRLIRRRLDKRPEECVL